MRRQRPDQAPRRRDGGACQCSGHRAFPLRGRKGRRLRPRKHLFQSGSPRRAAPAKRGRRYRIHHLHERHDVGPQGRVHLSTSPHCRCARPHGGPRGNDGQLHLRRGSALSHPRPAHQLRVSHTWFRGLPAHQLSGRDARLHGGRKPGKRHGCGGSRLSGARACRRVWRKGRVQPPHMPHRGRHVHAGTDDATRAGFHERHLHQHVRSERRRAAHHGATFRPCRAAGGYGRACRGRRRALAPPCQPARWARSWLVASVS